MDWIVGCAIAAGFAFQAEGGHGGNERVVVVANGASGLSLALARRYCALRQIPIEHLLVLDDVPGGGPASAEPIALADCRERILAPILQRLAQRGLADEIDAIVYSSGFPHAVDVAAAAQDRKAPQVITGVAALTGLTFFAREVVQNDLACLALETNRYCKSPLGKHAVYNRACSEALAGRKEAALQTLDEAIAAGFCDAAHADYAAKDPDFESLRGDAAFTQILAKMRATTTKPAPLEPQPSRGFGCDPEGRGRHYLSTFLAWLGPYGTTYPEAVANLERSAAADGTNPRGTIYFLKNGDVRATTREPLFAAAMRALAQRGRAAELLEPDQGGQDGILPKGKRDVIGAMVGISDFDWSACGSTILPGAIVEHLTSFGAAFQLAGQTKLTAFLRAGAAGASGTVTEPYAIQEKFPTPFVHVHYADGCTLAEAFFESVAGPYQLLVVGDACCRPFASFAKFAPLELLRSATARASGPASAAWRGTVALTPETASGDVTQVEAWIDGRPVAAAAHGAEFAIDTTAFDDGIHELHLVAVGPPPIGTASSLVRRVSIDNAAPDAKRSVTLSGPPQPVELGGALKLQGKAPAGATVELLEGERRLVAVVARGGNWRAELPTTLLGPGPCELRARVATAAATPSASVISDSFAATVVAPKILTSAKDPGDLLPGLALDVGAKPKEEKLGILGWSDAMPIAPGDAPAGAGGRASGTLRGWVKLPAAGLHEWSIAGGELVGLALDGKQWIADAATDTIARGASFDAELAAGWHAFELEVACDGGRSPRLSLLGPGGPVALAEGAFGHGPSGMKSLQREKLASKAAGWCDGDRTAAVPWNAGIAEVELRSGSSRVGAIAVYVACADLDPERLRKSVVIEGKERGGWDAVPIDEIRVIHSSATAQAPLPVSCLVWVAGIRRERRLQAVRIRSTENGTGRVAGVCEIEAWEAVGER